MRRTKKDSEETKRLILKAALDIFSEKSYNLATLNEIAQRAEVTRGAIYWHFADKMDILKELTAIHLGGFIELLNAELSNSEQNSLKKIEGIFNLYFRYYLDNEENMKYKKAIEGELPFNANSPFINEVFGEIVNKSINSINEIITIGQENNEIKKDIDSKFYTGMILNWLLGFDRILFVSTRNTNILKDRKAILENIIKILKP